MTLLLRNGSVHTMDPARPVATAVACRDGRILAVGSDAEAGAAAGPGAQVIDLHGRTVIPGLTDAHLHFIWYAVGLSRPNLDGARSLPEALARLGAALSAGSPGEWVLGSGWNHEDWAQPAFPCRQDLDGLTADRPVVLRRKDGHSVWANSLALERAGIAAGTTDPAGGSIDRDEHGSPTGILRENAVDLVLERVPPPGPDTLRRALAAGVARAHAAGLTGIHDMEGAEALALFQEAHGRGELTLRVTMQIPADNLEHALALGLRTGLGDDVVRIGHLKLFADGSLGSQTAWMLESFSGQSGNTGVSTTPPEILEQTVMRAARGGLACAIHAIGDRANRQVLDILERTGAGSPGGLRQRIEHVQVLHPADLPRLARLGVVASMQPAHATSDRYMADRLWGDRCRYAYAWRSLLDSGAVLAFGSDCPVEGLEPLQGIYAAVTRKRAAEPDSQPWYPEQRISVDEAVRAFTWGAAYAGGQEKRLGSITPGKLADLVVLSEDIVASSPESILRAQVDYTVVEGEVVHSR
jgi:predicted amidohydrolase YtcJ